MTGRRSRNRPHWAACRQPRGAPRSPLTPPRTEVAIGLLVSGHDRQREDARSASSQHASTPARAANGPCRHDGTIDRWIRRYRSGGFEAWPLSRAPATATSDRQAVLDLAAALKLEMPRRTAAQVAVIIRTVEGAGPQSAPCSGTVARLGLNTRPDGSRVKSA